VQTLFEIDHDLIELQWNIGPLCTAAKV